MKKNNFVLFEILIALFLLEIFAIPLMKKPIEAFRNERTYFEQIEGEKLADLAFLEIVEKLYTNEIQWEKLPKPGEEVSFELAPTHYKLLGFDAKKVQRKALIRCGKKGEKAQGQTIYRLLKIQIKLDPPLNKKKKGKIREYQFKIVVRKQNFE